ncbi:hypothetical protein C8J57DRAFT_1664456 [Mycena rebaudengoi]|nr:hypothetical protein C8J57DRAFT_1664456 [Mycena rebaudengoi]
MELMGTLILPAAISFTLYLIIYSTLPHHTDTTISLVILVFVLGLPLPQDRVHGLDAHLPHLAPNLEWAAARVCVLAFDDFSWGQMRKVVGDKTHMGDKEGEFDSTLFDTNNDSPLSQAELNEVEVHVRRFACGVGDCSRRYKNMNGLRYHYQHSGDHGTVGLGLLTGGVHGCLRANANLAPAKAAATMTACPRRCRPRRRHSRCMRGGARCCRIQVVASTPKTEATPASAVAPSITTAVAMPSLQRPPQGNFPAV